LLGPGATGIVGAAGGAMHAAKDMVAANAAAICGWKRFMVLPPDGKLSLRRVLLCRQVLKDLNAKAARSNSLGGARADQQPRAGFAGGHLRWQLQSLVARAPARAHALPDAIRDIRQLHPRFAAATDHGIAGHRCRERRIGDDTGIPPPPSAWKRRFQFAAGGNQTSMWIWGSTVICTRQKAIGTGGQPGNAGGGENVFAGIEVALIDVTSGKPRLDKLSHLRAAADAAAMLTPASAMAAAEHVVLGADLMVFLPPPVLHSLERLVLACG
jgi:hypothetical protein